MISGEVKSKLLLSLTTPKRFSEILKTSGVAESSIAKFLNEFEAENFIKRDESGAYALTEKGMQALDLVIQRKNTERRWNALNLFGSKTIKNITRDIFEIEVSKITVLISIPKWIGSTYRVRVLHNDTPRDFNPELIDVIDELDSFIFEVIRKNKLLQTRKDSGGFALRQAGVELYKRAEKEGFMPVVKPAPQGASLKGIIFTNDVKKTFTETMDWVLPQLKSSIEILQKNFDDAFTSYICDKIDELGRLYQKTKGA